MFDAPLSVRNGSETGRSSIYGPNQYANDMWVGHVSRQAKDAQSNHWLHSWSLGLCVVTPLLASLGKTIFSEYRVILKGNNRQCCTYIYMIFCDRRWSHYSADFDYHLTGWSRQASYKRLASRRSGIISENRPDFYAQWTARLVEYSQNLSSVNRRYNDFSNVGRKAQYILFWRRHD